jgi:hypothetical protein
LKLAVIGSGNVAAALAMELVHINRFDEVQFVARDVQKLDAALRDVASAHPRSTARFTTGTALVGDDIDIIVVTAGAQIPAGGQPRDLIALNVGIGRDFLSGHVGGVSKIVLVGSPVDEVTHNLADWLQVDRRRVIGFGGDLDVCRLEYSLLNRGIKADTAFIVGEHGSRAIPVYQGERLYPEISGEVRFFLKKMTNDAGRPRNLASGMLLCGLIQSLTSAIPTLHHVVTYCEEFGLFLTWPALISLVGVAQRIMPDLGPNASRELGLLVEARLTQRTENEVIGSAQATSI